MHELSIALRILEIAAETAAQNGDARILSIRLKLGELSGVDADALRFSFEVARGGTPQEHTELLIEDVPVRAFCPVCARESAVESIQCLCCSRCGAPVRVVLSGRELEVVAVEIQ